MSGPYHLIQGGYRLIGRLPVFIQDEFWGLVIATMDVDSLLESSGMMQLGKQGYYYSLATENDAYQREVFASTLPNNHPTPYELKFSIPNGNWVLSIVPCTGWYDRKLAIWYCLVAVIVSGLIAQLTYFLLKKPIVLSKLVNEKTMELHEMNNELKKSQIELKQLAYYDHLTGVVNRKYFYELFNEMLLECSADQYVCLLFIDLDKFKAINDCYGHDIGDKVLITTAKRMVESVPSSAVVGRFGGDEFGVCSSINHIDEGDNLVNAINNCMMSPMIIENNEITVSCSVGVAYYPIDGTTVEEIIVSSDKVMYQIKDSKRKVEGDA